MNLYFSLARNSLTVFKSEKCAHRYTCAYNKIQMALHLVTNILALMCAVARSCAFTLSLSLYILVITVSLAKGQTTIPYDFV